MTYQHWDSLTATDLTWSIEGYINMLCFSTAVMSAYVNKNDQK